MHRDVKGDNYLMDRKVEILIPALVVCQFFASRDGLHGRCSHMAEHDGQAVQDCADRFWHCGVSQRVKELNLVCDVEQHSVQVEWSW